MKRNKILFKVIAMGIIALLISCNDDEGPAPLTADLGSIASTYKEKDGTGTLMIPFRNASSAFVSSVDVTFGGTATEGEDFTVVGVTTEGIQLSIIDDNLLEDTETIRVMISPTNGNAIHTVTIESNCEDTDGYSFDGDYEVVIDDWEDYSKGDVLTVEIVDATHLRVVDYPGTSVNHVDMIITITNLATGAATVVSQNNGSYNASGTQQTTTSGSGSVTPCDGIQLTLNFALPCCGSFNDNAFVLKKK